MQSLDPNIEIGLFLHIPCLPPDNFFTKYHVVAFPILRGLLRFTKVGLQTERDRANLVRLVQEHLPTAKIVHESGCKVSRSHNSGVDFQQRHKTRSSSLIKDGRVRWAFFRFRSRCARVYNQKASRFI